jgi:hypothetical protein
LNLSTCGDTGNYLVITTDVERFFKVGGDNQNRTVILIALRQSIEQEINAAAKPFASIMPGWDAAKAPVGIFWRRGNAPETSWFDYLTTSSLSSISSENLFENWKKRICECVNRVTWCYTAMRGVLSHFHVVLMNQNVCR